MDIRKRSSVACNPCRSYRKKCIRLTEELCKGCVYRDIKCTFSTCKRSTKRALISAEKDNYRSNQSFAGDDISSYSNNTNASYTPSTNASDFFKLDTLLKIGLNLPIAYVTGYLPPLRIRKPHKLHGLYLSLSSPFLLPRISNSGLTNSRLKNLISSWIDKNGTYNLNNIPYEFKPILYGSRDGFSRSVFEEKCYNVKKTVVVIKIKETGQLVGGYNPVGWNMKEKSANRRYWIETNDSFIFKINEKRLNDSILSEVGDSARAIFHDKQNIDITHDDIKFHETTIDFFDLALFISTNNEPYCYYKTNDSYKKDLCIGDNTRKVHLVEELEVYELMAISSS